MQIFFFGWNFIFNGENEVPTNRGSKLLRLSEQED